MAEPIIHRFADHAAAIDGAARWLAERVAAHTAERGGCRLALSGGNTPKDLHRRLTQDDLRAAIDWSKVEIFWGDERCVPPDDADSNYRMAKETLLDPLGIDEARVHRIRGEDDPAAAAKRYTEELGAAPLDIVLLGMGGDGHTASLFPATEDLGAAPGAIATKSPAGPADRVTVTLGSLNAAREVAFLILGAGKAERLAEVHAQSVGDAPVLPAARVRPTSGGLHWFIDEAAGARLP